MKVGELVEIREDSIFATQNKYKGVIVKFKKTGDNFDYNVEWFSIKGISLGIFFYREKDLRKYVSPVKVGDIVLVNKKIYIVKFKNEILVGFLLEKGIEYPEKEIILGKEKMLIVKL